jgi:isopentenyl diphosphate isomerase/L-lactate dehydrogenase-like FMN-dependent dehydrogenase
MAAATGPVWFQLYVFKDRALTASLVQRAEAAGCKAVALTVDVPLPGKRERDVRVADGMSGSQGRCRSGSAPAFTPASAI